MELPDEVMIPEVTIPEVRVSRNIAFPVVVGVIALGVGVGVGYVLGKLRNKRPYFQGTESSDTDSPTEGGEEGARDKTATRAAQEVYGPGGGPKSLDSQLEFTFDGGREGLDDIRHPESASSHRAGGQTSLAREETIGDTLGLEVEKDERRVERWNYRDADVWVQSEEAQNRTPNRPYVIHVSEYSSNESDYPHEELMYYVKDDVLCAKDGSVLYNRNDYGLLLFGHGSEDENLVYVRNEKLECEYEIYRLDEHYGVEVLGYDEEITHSRGHKPRKGKQHPKFRQE